MDPVGEGGWPVVSLREHLLLYLPDQLRMTLLPLARVEAQEVLQQLQQENLALQKHAIDSNLSHFVTSYSTKKIFFFFSSNIFQKHSTKLKEVN